MGTHIWLKHSKWIVILTYSSTTVQSQGHSKGLNTGRCVLKGRAHTLASWIYTVKWRQHGTSWCLPASLWLTHYNTRHNSGYYSTAALTHTLLFYRRQTAYLLYCHFILIDVHVVSWCLCVQYRPHKLLNKTTNFHKTWYEHHDTSSNSISVLFNFQSQIVLIWWVCKLATLRKHHY